VLYLFPKVERGYAQSQPQYTLLEKENQPKDWRGYCPIRSADAERNEKRMTEKGNEYPSSLPFIVPARPIE
jgi:hypothetical protein